MVKCRIAGVAADHLDLLWYAGGAGAVDHPDGLAAATQGVQRGEADRAGAEDDVPRMLVMRCPSMSGGRPGLRDRRLEARTGSSTAAAPRRGRRR